MIQFRYYGDAVLRKQAAPVTVFNDDLKRFAREMTVIMREHDGVGLAAPQVGHSIRLAVIAAGSEDDPVVVLVNPQIIWCSAETEEKEEGCLSIPGINLKVLRPASISVTAFDVTGKEIVFDKTEGLFARALQHEIDHLNGIMFVDRLSPGQRQMISGKLKKIARGEIDTKDDES